MKNDEEFMEWILPGGVRRERLVMCEVSDHGLVHFSQSPMPSLRASSSGTNAR